MSLLNNPIPPKPGNFSPMGSPSSVSEDFNAFKDNANNPWWKSRPIIKPTMIVVHTNGASVEASLQSQINWGNNSKYSNTHPHYAINQPSPTKLVPTDRRAIANSTASSIENQYGVRDASFWSIAIETADMGSKAANNKGLRWPTDCGPFLHDHAERIAQIIAYESIVWDIPLVVPANFGEPGVVAHTWPFPYPYITTVAGKTCPGTTKINQLRFEIIPRAKQIKEAWTNTSGIPNMSKFKIHDPVRILDTRPDGDPAVNNRKTRLHAQEKLTLKPHNYTPNDADGVILTITSLKNDGVGFFTFYKEGNSPPKGSNLNKNDVGLNNNMVWVTMNDLNTFKVFSSHGGHLVIDQIGFYKEEEW